MRENKQNRKQFQVIEVPAAGEQRAARIAYTHDTPEKAVETARWGALMNPRSGRLYRVRDRTRKEIIFEIDANRTLPDLLSAVLYDSSPSKPEPLTSTYPGEWLHEDYRERDLKESTAA